MVHYEMKHRVLSIPYGKTPPVEDRFELSDLNDGELWLLIQDLIGPKRGWPKYMLSLMFKQGYLKNGERFSLTVFLLANGLQPELIVLWYARMRMLRDVSAHRHVEWLIKNYPYKNWTQWNMAHERNV